MHLLEIENKKRLKSKSSTKNKLVDKIIEMKNTHQKIIERIKSFNTNESSKNSLKVAMMI